jgi:hypothetical protein
METKQIYAAFVKAQTGFSAALKTATNPHFKSRYADLAACVEAVIDSLNSNGIALVQETHPSETGVIVETRFIHSSGESFTGGQLHVPASKVDAQGYGSALTYARRYSLMAACGIAPEDDDGNAASKKPEPVEKTLAQSVLSDLLASISETASLEDLKNAYTKAISVAGSDKGAVTAIIKAKDSRKAQLTEKVAA